MPVSRNAVSGNSAPVSDNSIPKLDRKYTHIVNNDATVGLNGVPGQHEVSDTTRGNAFLEGMSNVFNTVGNAVGQGVNKLKQALVSSGNASWFGGEEQKAAAEQVLREEEAANREAINEYRDYRNTLKEEHPIAYGAGDFLTKSQLYRGAGGLGAATGAEAALSGKIGETGANLALGQAADVLLDTIPTEIENYQNGMSGKDIAIDTAKNLGTNALFNLGAEGLQTLPGLLKNAANNWTADQLAKQEVENAIKAESAPIAENTLKQLEPPVAPVREELNPLGMATKDAELEELAAQRQSAMDAIDGLRQEIPETPSQPLTDLANGQTVETLTDTVKPEITANKSELQGITDSIINARNTQDLVGNGYGKEGQEYLKNINTLQKQETNILEQAEKIDDPTVRQLVDEVNSTSEAYWNNVSHVNTPVNPDLINTHRQALENLDNYMKNMPENYGDTIRRSVKELEMPKETRKEITNRLKGMESYADRINNAATREELQSIVSDAEKMAGDTEALLKQSASTRMIKKGDFDEPTQAFVDALNGKKIYLSPEVRANFTDMKNINDFGNQLYFSGNGGRFKPAFRSTPKNATAIDQIFPEIDRETGYAISNFMESNGLNPDNAADQVRGLLDYGNYLKSNKDSMKVRPYEGGLLDDFMGNIRKTAEDKLNTFKEAVTPEPRLKPDLQFFADKANDLEKQIANMPEGEEKASLKQALGDFWNRIFGAKSKEEAEEAWNALSKTRTNTMFNSGDFTDYELENVFPESMARYLTQEETVPYDNALAKIEKDYAKELKKFTKDFKTDAEVRANLGNAEDINGMYIMMQDLTKRARATEDLTARNNLYAQARKVSRNLIKAERESGRSIQALAKFSRTPERMIQRAEALAEDFVDKKLQKDPNLRNGIEQVSDQINNFLKDMDTAALNREEVEDMVNRAILMNKRVRSRLGKGDVQKITNAIMEERQYADIQKQLEFLSTGYRDVDGNTMEKVQDMFNEAQDLPFNSKKRVDLENDAFKLLASRIAPEGGTFRDKIDAWRYLSMLANPTTHLKNMLGNFSFGKGMVSTKNNLAALIEGAADNVSKLAGKGGIDRTKAILNPAKDSALIKAAGEDGLENAFRELSGSHYFDAGKSIDNAIPAFNTKTKLGRFLNRAAEINEGLLSKEDEMAMMSKYKTSLAGYLKANGADASIFKATDDQSKQLLENGRQYAINQAKEAAFHQDAPFMQKFSNFTNDLKNGTKGEQAAGLILDTVVPFKKTPANILKSAFAYSPLEWGKVLTDIDLLKKGADATGKAFKAADFIDDISKAATGTAAFTIGAILAHEGILKVGSDLSDEESSFDKQTGRQNVSIALKLPGIGDFYVPIQELMPSAAPLIFGGTVYETLKNKKDGDTAINTLAAGTGAIANGLIDMSMLSGIADTLKSVRGAETNTDVITNLAVNAGGNFASQMLPTVGRKANVTIDDTKRATYSDKKGVAKTIDQEVKYLQTKVPGLQQLGEKMKESDIPALQKAGNRLALEPNIDVKGQVQESPGVAGNNGLAARAANNFLVSSLGNITKDTSTKYDEERRRLMKATGVKEVLPYIGSKEAEIDGVRMSPKDWTEYRKTRGQLREKLAETVIDSADYKKLSDVNKAALLKQVDSFTKDYAQSKFGKEMDSGSQNIADIYEKEGIQAAIDEITYKSVMSGYKLRDSDKYREIYETSGRDGLKNYADYAEKAKAYNESHDIKNMGSMKKTDKMAVLKSMPLEQQEILLPNMIESDADKERWRKSGKDVKTYWKMYDRDQREAQKNNAEKQQFIKSAGVTSTEDTQKELASYGAEDSPTTVEFYARAKKEIPSLTPKIYSQYLKSIGGNNMKINQDELIFYANRNKLSEKEINTYWKAFGNDWKQIPKLDKNGNWTKGKASKKKK